MEMKRIIRRKLGVGSKTFNNMQHILGHLQRERRKGRDTIKLKKKKTTNKQQETDNKCKIETY